MQEEAGRPLYRAAQVRELDRRTIAAGIEGFALMQRAAMAAYGTLRGRWPAVKRLSVLCGAGNNAGDGYVIAALAALDGLEVQLYSLRDPASLEGDAARAAMMARQAGVAASPWTPQAELNGELIVDALLGTGLTGEVRAPFAAAIEAINASARPVLAVDIPSGLSADTGAMLGSAVRASLTVTFIADKLGLHTGAGPAFSGEVRLEALGVEPLGHEDLVPAAWRLGGETALPPRPRDSHKGNFGHLLVIGGAPGFGGAALLASQAAARLGAGKVSLATAPEHVTASLVRCPEVMVHGVRGASDLGVLLDTATVLVVGPGLGLGAWGQAMLQAALSAGKPLVVDADALTLLVSRWPTLKRDDWLLTPHPGEAARLLASSGAAIQADRPAAVRELVERRGGVAVLKGAGSLIADEAGLAVCPFGNPGMASGGMGDALSGLLGALIAQGLSLPAAARLGVVLHARAADQAAAASGERGLLAGDLASYARRLINGRTSDARDTSG
ncbi:NAD(P)H-hydrate dehydratase [Halomonas sp. YLGW01]|uniref:NAD(P)H-hydrate dehydratase n=1 Tax=Halomonas sp. YLGW01 TaxID=2773308 RepID=UPI0017804224|nr:NAD(P)H-hydrate dehydratase [Halomonas sp. YLGW01]